MGAHAQHPATLGRWYPMLLEVLCSWHASTLLPSTHPSQKKVPPDWQQRLSLGAGQMSQRRSHDWKKTLAQILGHTLSGHAARRFLQGLYTGKRWERAAQQHISTKLLVK